MAPVFNEYQYQDLLNREIDPYSGVKAEIIADYLARWPRGTLLNAGCGSGELSLQLAARGFRVTGIDPVKEYIALAQSRQKNKSGGDCIFQIDSIETFQSEAPFDYAVCTDVLEHIEDDAAASIKLAANLKRDGLLIVTVPAYPSLFGFHDKELGHWRRYTKKDLTRLLQNAGFSITQIRYFGSTLLPVAWWYSKLRQRPYPLSTMRDNSPRQIILKKVLDLDRRLALPFGISLIAFARKI